MHEVIKVKCEPLLPDGYIFVDEILCVGIEWSDGYFFHRNDG